MSQLKFKHHTNPTLTNPPPLPLIPPILQYPWEHSWNMAQYHTTVFKEPKSNYLRFDRGENDYWRPTNPEPAKMPQFRRPCDPLKNTNTSETDSFLKMNNDTANTAESVTLLHKQMRKLMDKMNEELQPNIFAKNLLAAIGTANDQPTTILQLY